VETQPSTQCHGRCICVLNGLEDCYCPCSGQSVREQAGDGTRGKGGFRHCPPPISIVRGALERVAPKRRRDDLLEVVVTATLPLIPLFSSHTYTPQTVSSKHPIIIISHTHLHNLASIDPVDVLHNNKPRISRRPTTRPISTRRTLSEVSIIYHPHTAPPLVCL
jgi:hypothetical protein